MRNIIALVLLKFALCLSQVSKTYEALNSSCINQTYLLQNMKDPTLFVSLPTFFQATLEVDLRHLQSSVVLNEVTLTVLINNKDTNSTYTETIPLSLSSKTYSIFAANNLTLRAYFTITGNSTHQVTGKSYLFSRSVSLIITQANPQGQEQNSFLFIVTNTDLISLPYNMINSTNTNNFDGYFISQINSMSELQSRQTSIPSYSDYWNGLQSVALPYVPYLSNCQDQGNYMYFSQLIHNQSYCQLYGDQAVPLNEFSFGSTATADNCQFTTHCVYDQIPSISNEYPFWSTVGDVGATLFSITATEQTSQNLLQNFDSTQLVPCLLKSTSGSNSSSQFPLKVSISFGYYQSTSNKRQMITCEVEFSLYTENKANFTYQLDISVYPLTHTQVLLNFGFKWYIYMLVFIIIGLISNFQFIVFWCYHLIVTIKEKRNFNLRIYLKLAREILKGILPAAFISILLTFFVQILMNGTFFGKALFGDHFTSFWNYLIMNDIGYFGQNIESSTRSGRMGFSYVVISLYLIIVLSDHLIGKQRKKQEYQTYEILGRKFKPQEWNRGKLMFVTLTYMLFSIYFIYFTFTSMFSENIWFIIAFLQIFQMVCQEVADAIFDDKLPCIPLKLTLGVLAYLATMGAIDLYYFILGYLVDVGISIIQITYLSQLQKGIKDYIEQKNEEINKFFAKIFNDQEDDQQKKSQGNVTVFNNDEILINQELIQVNFLEKQVIEAYNDLSFEEIPVYQQDEQIKRRFLEHMMQSNRIEKNENKSKGGAFVKNEEYERQREQFQNIKFQLIIDGSSAMMQYLVQPIIVFILWITYNTSTILSNFQISNQNTILYLLSSIILALFYQINVIIIFHVLELYLNTDYDNQFKQLLQRFQNRSSFWITDEQHINTKYQINLRGLYSYSISSQLFFIVGLYTISIYHFINGAITIISASFNIFKDPYIVLITAFWIIFMQLFSWVLKQIAKLFDIWSYSSLQTENKSETNIEEPFSSFEQETNQMLKKQEMFNSSSIKFTFKRINQPIQKMEEEHIEQIKKKNLESKLATICKKLQPEFDKQDFRLNFARKNKDFIRQNIQKILPLVKSFPSDDTAWIGKGNVINKRDMKKQNKNCDPMISDFLGNWMRRVETNRAKRQEEGIEHQRKLKRCKFCFQTWGLYYGYDGICLQCSDNLFKNQQLKKSQQLKKTK